MIWATFWYSLKAHDSNVNKAKIYHVKTTTQYVFAYCPGFWPSRMKILLCSSDKQYSLFISSSRCLTLHFSVYRASFFALIPATLRARSRRCCSSSLLTSAVFCTSFESAALSMLSFCRSSSSTRCRPASSSTKASSHTWQYLYKYKAWQGLLIELPTWNKYIANKITNLQWRKRLASWPNLQYESSLNQLGSLVRPFLVHT